MQASDDTRKRLIAVLATGGALLGGWSLWGAASRWAESRSAPLEFAPRRVSQDIARQARLVRAVRAALVERGKAKDWDAVLRLADTACTKDDCPDTFRSLRAEAALRAGKVALAQDDFAQLLANGANQGFSNSDLNPGMGLAGGANPIGRADYLAVAGKRAEYEDHRRTLNQEADPDTSTPLAANNRAWACALLPGQPADFAHPLALARSAVARTNGRERATYLNTLGVVQFRRGDLATAIATLRQAESLQEEPFNWPFLAMALRQRGNADEAARWEKKLRTFLDTTFGDATNNRHELLLFFQEMEQTRRR